VIEASTSAAPAPSEAPVMTETFASPLLRLVSFILPGHRYSGPGTVKVGISIRMEQRAKMTFCYPLVL